ncbi:MAG: LLM class flavin-dependent oxidoreductase [Candidatus Hodarchaeales archaeon]|jgi:F420-dependent oxidoreductase-like protein
MKFGIALSPDYIPRAMALQAAEHVETLGYDSIWVPEIWGRDAFTFLTQLAEKTTRVRIGSGIVNVFSRSPATLATTAASIDEISNGRFVLGLGLSGPIVIQDWHGAKWSKPLQRTREYFEIIRLILSGERVNYDGQIFKLKNFRLPGHFKPVRSNLPLFLAALGPKNIALAGEIADGLFPIWMPGSKSREMIVNVQNSAAAAGRPKIEVAQFILTAVSEQDPEHAKMLMRQHMAYYIAGMGTFYANLLSRLGYADEVREIRLAWDVDYTEMAAVKVSDRLLDELAVVGTPHDCIQKMFYTYEPAGVDTAIIMMPYGISPEMALETMNTFAQK